MSERERERERERGEPARNALGLLFRFSSFFIRATSIFFGALNFDGTKAISWLDTRSLALRYILYQKNKDYQRQR